jgi:hypothetical protein
MLAARAVRLVVYGPGEEDLKILRPILAEMGMWVIDTTDFCGMGIKDPKGKSWHEYDWGSTTGLLFGWQRTKCHCGPWILPEARMRRGKRLRTFRAR